MRQVESRGLEGLTLQEIARDLDYSVAALYRYFPSKDALIAELQRRVVALLDRKLAEVEERCQAWHATRPPEEAARIEQLVNIAAAGLFYARLAQRAPQAFGLLAISLGDPRRLIDDDHARAVIDTARPMFSRIAGHADRAARSGCLAPGDATNRAVILWGALHGVAQLGKLSDVAPEFVDRDGLCDGLLHSLLVGWGADPDRALEAIEAVSAAGLDQGSVSARDLALVSDAAGG